MKNKLSIIFGMCFGLSTLQANLAIGASIISIKINSFQYSRQYADSESGLQYLTARYYNPQLSRFVQVDSYDLLNRYAYADGNPVMNDDPSGHVPDWAISALAAANVVPGIGPIASTIFYGTQKNMTQSLLAGGSLFVPPLQNTYNLVTDALNQNWQNMGVNAATLGALVLMPFIGGLACGQLVADEESGYASLDNDEPAGLSKKPSSLDTVVKQKLLATETPANPEMRNQNITMLARKMNVSINSEVKKNLFGSVPDEKPIEIGKAETYTLHYAGELDGHVWAVHDTEISSNLNIPKEVLQPQFLNELGKQNVIRGKALTDVVDVEDLRRKLIAIRNSQND